MRFVSVEALGELGVGRSWVRLMLNCHCIDEAVESLVAVSSHSSSTGAALPATGTGSISGSLLSKFYHPFALLAQEEDVVVLVGSPCMTLWRAFLPAACPQQSVIMLPGPPPL